MGSVEKKFRVAGYCRVSTIEQQTEGESLQMQEEKILDYCRNNSLDLKMTMKEQISGAIDPSDRPQMKVLLAMLDGNLIDGIVVTKLDRFSRSIRDFIFAMDMFKKKKWRFYSIVPNINPDDKIYGDFTMKLLALIAELERNMISERVKDVLAMKRSLGQVSGTIPFGFMKSEISGLVIQNPEEQRTIRMAIEKRAEMKEAKKEGGKRTQTSYKEVCDYLVKERRANREGNINWFPSQVRKMCLGQPSTKPKSQEEGKSLP
jgi:site-specific DNA recombinase